MTKNGCAKNQNVRILACSGGSMGQRFNGAAVEFMAAQRVMSKYMFKSMGPATVTKPKECAKWKTFYDVKFAPINKAIKAEDFTAFHNRPTQR